jgi:hypothetical protein
VAASRTDRAFFLSLASKVFSNGRCNGHGLNELMNKPASALGLTESIARRTIMRRWEHANLLGVASMLVSSASRRRKDLAVP